MKRILLIGNAPLPSENTKCRPAAGLRTNQFLKPLLEVAKICAVNIAMPECYSEEVKFEEIKHSDEYTEIKISKNDSSLLKRLQSIHDEFIPDAIVAVNTYPSYIASQLKSRAAFWADLNGWIMAEAQAQAYKMDSNEYIAHYYKMEKSILKSADKFSTVSRAQMFALLGELSSIGRINKESFSYQFVHHIPNGVSEMTIGDEQLAMKKLNLLNDVPDDAFVLLWMGGYNTWADEVALFKGVEAAMSKCEKLYFVSTGGAIEGLDNKTFAKFKEMIDKSEYKNRFVFLGWVDSDDIPYIYRKSDCGLNVDRLCAETLTGARNRINEMMKFGLPVITTLGSEISYEVERIGAGMGVKSGNHEFLSDAISYIYKEWYVGGRENVKFQRYTENGKKYIQEECNYEKICKPLIKWVENPRPSPDRGIDVNLGGMGIKSAFLYIRQNGLKKFFKKFWQKF